MLQLAFPDLNRKVEHVVARDGGRIVGYGALLPTERRRPMVAELAVHPSAAGLGVGRRIVTAMLEIAGAGGLELWAHGRGSSAGRLAASLGFEQRRRLLQMQRSLEGGLPAAEVPGGYRIRTFQPGADDAAFLAANAAAFTQLPDQGGWGPADLSVRLAEPWFDPAGFFLASANGGDGVAGFHWTKMHPPQPLGEVYVLAVTPPHRGRGLAKPLAVVGLRHLRRAGATRAMLYVDASNTPALGLYEGLGFTVADVDVLYGRAGDG